MEAFGYFFYLCLALSLVLTVVGLALSKKLHFRFGIILTCTFAGLLALWPPQEKLKLGIDLSGGTILVYEVARENLGPDFDMDKLISALKQRAYPQGVKETPIRKIGNNRIEIFNPDGTFKTSWNASSYSSQHLWQPTDIKLDANGNAFVSTYGEAEEFDPSGNLVSSWGSGPADPSAFSSATGIAVRTDPSDASKDDVFVADSNSQLVKEFSGIGGSGSTTGANYVHLYGPVLGPLQTFTHGMDRAFLLAVPVAALAFLLSFLLRDLRLRSATGAPGPRRPSTAGPLWFRKMDRNGDGDVSPREFLGTAEQFRRLDLDGDGLISVEEAEKADALLRKK